MAESSPQFYFIRQGGRITGPFAAAKLSDMERSGRLADGAEWSVNKVQWRPISALPWKTPEAPPIFLTDTPDSHDSPGLSVSPPDEAEDEAPAELMAGALRVARREAPRHQFPTVFPSVSGGGGEGGADCQGCDSAGEFWGGVAAILWRPSDAFAELHARWGDSMALRAGLVLMGMAAGLMLFIICHCLPQIGNKAVGSSPSIVEAAFAVAMPIASLFVCCLLCRTFFGDPKRGGFGGDVLMAGGFAWFAAATLAALLSIARLAVRGSLDSNSIVVGAAVIAIAVYGVTCVAVSMFNGLTDLSGVPRKSACALLAAVGAGACILTYVLFKTFSKMS